MGMVTGSHVLRRLAAGCAIGAAVVGGTAASAIVVPVATPPVDALPVPRVARPADVASIRINPVAFRLAGAPVVVPAVPAAAPIPAPLVTTTARPGTAAARAIGFALAQRGLPYVWGGDGPQRGDAGFDCSGLTTAAYSAAGIDLPRTAHTQYYAGPHVPDDAPLEPGDLVFYGVPERVHHVGLYLGDGRMVNAPTFGRPVRLAYVRYD
ncbi:C40 family peptidase, partial [Pseudonocardia sp. KRD-169]|nr:C40 family peptidase [Pseudonocardia abyssalis]